MTIIGIILVVAGVVIAGLVFTGSAPEALMNLNWPIWVWLVVAAVGVALIFFNRRPND
ncbi:MAG: hypothetical protein HYV26_18565 [Candidatus Hydrogenedentes bacterium]|nr:hypothetical protein [Candidatus Hydrogenedentota bacterium]